MQNRNCKNCETNVKNWLDSQGLIYYWDKQDLINCNSFLYDYNPSQSQKSLVVSDIVLKNKFAIKRYETVLYTCDIRYLNKINENSDLIHKIFLCETLQIYADSSGEELTWPVTHFHHSENDNTYFVWCSRSN